MTPEGDPHRVMVAGDPGHRGVLGLLEPQRNGTGQEWFLLFGQGGNGTGHEAQGGGPRPPETAPTGGSPGRHGPADAQDWEVHAPLDLGRDQVSPSGSGQEGERGGRPKDVRSLLGLRTEAGAPGGLARSPPKVGNKGGPAQPKAKRATHGPADQRARKPKRLLGPSGDPRGHIQRWLAPGVVAEQTGQESGPPSMGERARRAPLHPSPLTDCGMGPRPGPGSVPGVPGSSADPPPGILLRRALGPTLSDRSLGHGGQRVAGGGRMEGTQAGLQARASVVQLPSDGAGALPDGHQFNEDAGFLVLLSDIHDFSYTSPEGGATGPPRPGRRATGQLEPD